METTAIKLSESGKKYFGKGDFENAVQSFSNAVKIYTEEENFLDAAEAKNNLSVALLQAERAEESLEAVHGTDLVFAEAKDLLRQAMALGNQAAALDALGQSDKALEKYAKSAALFGEIGEGDLEATVLKSMAAIKFRKGKLQDTANIMLDSLGATQKPNLFQRFLKFIMRIIQ